MKKTVIVAMGRSAIGKSAKGSLKDTKPEDFGAEVLKGVLNKIPNLNIEKIDDVIIGCANPEKEQGYNIARMICLRAGLPTSISAFTLNRFCSSGLEAIATASNSIISGQNEIVVAGGIESMSFLPMHKMDVRVNKDIYKMIPSAYLNMGQTAENVAEQYNVTREEQDIFAVESHEKAALAQDTGKFEDEIIPIETYIKITDQDGNKKLKKIIFNKDEGIRRRTTVEKLSELKTVFKENGTVTAGNASQTSDGAAFVVLMSEEKAQKLGVKPLAKFIGYKTAGVDPGVMGIGPMKAVPKVLENTNMSLDDIDLIELNEAFASQSIACIRELGLNKEIINVNGGAIALGHPLGCSGAYLTIKLISELKRRNQKFGLVTMCIGGGMGAAGIFESI